MFFFFFFIQWWSRVSASMWNNHYFVGKKNQLICKVMNFPNSRKWWCHLKELMNMFRSKSYLSRSAKMFLIWAVILAIPWITRIQSLMTFELTILKKKKCTEWIQQNWPKFTISYLEHLWLWLNFTVIQITGQACLKSKWSNVMPFLFWQNFDN